MKQPISYGLAVGGGFDRIATQHRVGLDVRYVLGLTDLLDAEDTVGDELRNRGLTISLAYLF